MKKTPHITFKDIFFAGALIVACAVFVTTIRGVNAIEEVENTTISVKAAPLNAPETPKNLHIPSISLVTTIAPVGISYKGAMMPPPSFEEVGWYKYGVKPGEVGNAYIAGHLDNAYGKDSEFKDLEKVIVGDYVYIQDHASTTHTFKIIEKKIVPHNTASLKSIVAPTNTLRRVVLITCHGEWLKKEKTYSDRMVVIAELQ